jgi:hypothetical protein
MSNKNSDGTSDPTEPIHMEPEDYASSKLEAGQLLWHYTKDFSGLNGIIGGEIWASSLPYLNDTEEFRYGVSVALDTLKELLDDNAHMQALWIKLANGLLVQYTPHDVFSISFSTEEDDLSQWRAYSGTGPSFSVGFDPRKLEAHAIGYLFQLHEVKYKKVDIAADVKQELKEEIDYLNNAVRSCSESTSPAEFAKQQTPGMLTLILQLAPRYKHPKFSGEKEWRLIRWMPVISRKPRLPRRFRLSGSLVVPYIAMPLHTPLQEAAVVSGAEQVESPMSAVTIGPSPHKDQLEFAIGDITARCGLSVQVKSSEVPFRNW